MSDRVPESAHEVECEQRGEWKTTNCAMCVRINAAYNRGRVEAATAIYKDVTSGIIAKNLFTIASGFESQNIDGGEQE